MPLVFEQGLRYFPRAGNGHEIYSDDRCVASVVETSITKQLQCNCITLIIRQPHTGFDHFRIWEAVALDEPLQFAAMLSVLLAPVRVVSYCRPAVFNGLEEKFVLPLKFLRLEI